jgi:hypothetical protein
MRALGVSIALFVVACGSSQDDAISTEDVQSGSGGSVGITTTHDAGTGGKAGSGTGGAKGTGGTTAGTGGTKGTGGAFPGTGGSAGAGGSSTKGGSTGSGGATGTGGSLSANGCPSSQTPGTWQNVTPPTMKMTKVVSFLGIGPVTVLADPAQPSHIYANADYDGTWESTDCGVTFTKISTGTDGDKLDTGAPWGAVIDPNPNRDPKTPPTMYVNQGYGAMGLWKSTDGGHNWADVWTNNIYKADGVTNISSDVGNDLAAPTCVSTTDANHLIIFLHGYSGSGGNNGVFETTDGGAKWVLHPTPGFNFQPHSDLLSAIDANTWWVARDPQFWRSTDTGATWNLSTGDTSKGMGHSIARAGGAIYSGSDFWSGAFKTTDRGASWTKLPTPGGGVSWIATTSKNLYVSSGAFVPPHILHAPLSNDMSAAAWVDDGNPAGMSANGANNPAVIFDGTHYVVVAGQEMGGLWRYVEP